MGDIETGRGGGRIHPFDEREAEGTIIARLEQIARLAPDSPALSDGPRPSITFGELCAQIGGASTWIRAQHGEGREPIAILMPQRAATVAAELAVIASGRAAMPLDPTYPASHLSEMLEDAGPVAVVCAPETESAARAVAGGRPVHLWTELPTAPATAPARPLSPEDPAFVLFTAGSTGRAKGITLDHRAFLRAGRVLALEGVLAPGDRVATVAPLNYGGSAAQLTWILVAGAEACVFPVRDRGVPALVRWMRDHEITVLAMVPTLGRATAAAIGDDPLPSMRAGWVGGESIEASDVEAIRRMGSGPVDVVTLYASTEAMLVAWERIGPEVDATTLRQPTIGTPLDGIEIELVPLDPGDPVDMGEIVVTAPLHTEGYLGPAEVTTDRFEFDLERSTMRYRTGDMGRRVGDRIQIIGRVDSMVKVRGMRVELGAVELALRSVPGVDDAAAVAVSTARRDLALIGHVAGSIEAGLDAASIRAHLRRNLPPQMVPLHVVVHRGLPRLPSGKVDRIALEAVVPSVDDRYAPPANDVERRLVKAIEERIGIAPIGVDRDLFAQGLDSFAAIELLVHVEEEFGVAIPLSSWLELTTVRELAAAIEAGGMAGGSTVVPIQGGDDDRPPLLFANDLHGSAFRFRELAAAVGADQPAWGLDSPLREGRAGVPDTLEGLARIHVDDLLAASAPEPHHLVGYSFGTLLVVEMARQLQARGAEVGFVGLIDFGPVHARHALGRRDPGKPLGGWPDRAPSNLPVADRVRVHVDRLREMPSGTRLRYLSRVFDVAKQHDLAVARLDLRKHGQVRPSLRSAYCWYRQVQAAVAYSLPPLEHDVTLFVSDQTAKGKIDVSRRIDYASLTAPDLGWGSVVRGGIEIVPVVGYHNDLVEEPYVEDVGRVVRAAFERWLEGRA